MPDKKLTKDAKRSRSKHERLGIGLPVGGEAGFEQETGVGQHQLVGRDGSRLGTFAFADNRQIEVKEAA